jgi:hypothetical protein
MKTQILIILSIILLSFAGCKKDEPIELNNEVMISLIPGMGTSDTAIWIYSVPIPYFDISNYSNVNSATMLVSNIKTYGLENYSDDVTGDGTWELYDLTNDKVIENSAVTSDDIPEGTYKSSANFLNNIPGGKIKLGIRISGGANYSVECGNITLVLSK